MPELLRADDPFELAQDFQHQLIDHPFERRIVLAEEALLILGRYALQLQETNAKYVIDFSQAFDRPKQPFSPKQTLVSFCDTAVEGTFLDFDYTSIGSLFRHPINSLCVSLEDVTLIPHGVTLPEGDILHIPVLAVDQKLRVA
jgi:hypothetical protein